MEENKNETKGKRTKSFKLDEEQMELVGELLAEVEGETDAERLINSLQLSVQQTKLNSLPENIDNSFEGDREKIKTALHMIQSTFESLMISTSEAITIREDKIQAIHVSEISKLESKIDELENSIERHKETATQSQEECKAAKLRESEMKKEFDSISSELEFKDQVIAGLTKQLEDVKEEMTQLKEESKTQLAKKDSEIADLVTDSRKFKEKIEKLELKNEELVSKSTKSQQVNQELTGQLSLLEVNFKHEQEKVADLKAQLTQLHDELAHERELLAQERANSTQIQSQFMQLMNSISSKAEESTNTEVKDQSSEQPRPIANKFKLKDQKSGKVIWEGNRKGLNDRAKKHLKETKQEDVKITNNTDISELQKIFSPLILEY